MARLSFVSAMLRVSPPWLRRLVGARLMESLGVPAETLVERMADGVKLRFPRADGDADALAMIGRERRIRRGPIETAETYAERLQTWWDAHRERGTPYGLLRQLYLYWRDALGVRMDVVYHSGSRRWIDAAGNITRDSITWSISPDGTNEWAQVWVVYWVPSAIPIDALLVTSWNELITTLGGAAITVSYSIDPGALTDAEAEVFKAIPREWSAAHVRRTHVVLLWGVGELWDYHAPDGSQDGTWDEWEDPTKTFDEDAPTILIIQE